MVFNFKVKDVEDCLSCFLRPYLFRGFLAFYLGVVEPPRVASFSTLGISFYRISSRIFSTIIL